MLYNFLKNNSECIIIVANKRDILKNINFLHNNKIIGYKEFQKKNIVERKVFYLLYKENNDYQYSKMIYSMLEIFNNENYKDQNYMLIQMYYNKYKKYIKIKKYNNMYTYGINICSIDRIDQLNNKTIDIYEFENRYEEMIYSINKIANLIKEDIPPEKIDICIENSYKKDFGALLSLANIKMDKIYKKRLLNFRQVREFIDTLNFNALDDLEENIKEEVINIINEYGLNSNFLKEIFYEKEIIIKQMISSIKYKDVEDLNSCNFIFCIGFQDLSFFKVKQDIGFLKDEFLTFTSSDYNNIQKNIFENAINRCENHHISYTNIDKGEKVNYNSVLKDVNIKKEIFLDLKTRLKIIDQYVLNDCETNYKKYKIIDTNFKNIYKRELISEKFDFTFQADIKNNNKLELSATSIKEFNSCQYNFYLKKILKLREKNQRKIELSYGNYIHKFLELYFKEEFGFENIDACFAAAKNSIQSYILHQEQNFENIYLKKIDEHLRNLCNIIQGQHNSFGYKLIGLEDEYRDENKIILNNQYSLVGSIDKVLKDEYDRFIVIDYKSGDSKLDFKKLEDGTELQNLIYFKLLKSKYDNVLFGATYRQTVGAKFSKEEQLYMLKGYTYNSNTNIEKLNNGNVEMKKDNLIDDDQFNKYLNIVDQKIEELIKILSSGNIEIKPKNSACKYCSYKRICYIK